MIEKLEKGEISSEYFTKIRIEIRKNKYSGIKENEVEEIFFDTLQKLYDEEIKYEKINVNYRVNKDIIINIIDIINKINKLKRNKLNWILNMGRYDVVYERV